MHTSLTALASEFDAAALWAKRLADQYPAAAWTPRPASGGWPAVDCLAHLNVTAAAFWPGLERAWQAVQAMPSAGEPFRLSLLERLLLWFIEPPYRQKIKTPPAFEPTTQPTTQFAEQVRAQFQDHSARLAAFVLSLEGFAVDRPRLVSPFNPRIHYSLWAGLKIMVAHHRRHLWQAERTLAQAAAPQALITRA
ncbi:MAG: DinB family protein [Acidobacteria bacterium]|nr:DinB family protein [Acidobacteriota bacterium]